MTITSNILFDEIVGINNLQQQLLDKNLDQYSNNEFVNLVATILERRLEDYMSPDCAIAIANDLALEISREIGDMHGEVKQSVQTVIDRCNKNIRDKVQILIETAKEKDG